MVVTDPRLAWRRMLLSKSFGESFDGLCQTISRVTRKLYTERNDSIDTFLACRMIPLDKKTWSETDWGWRGPTPDHRESSHVDNKRTHQKVSWLPSSLCWSRGRMQGSHSRNERHLSS